jgi:hypothetical protein
MADMHVVDALAGDAGSYLLAVLLDVEDKGQEALYVGGGDIVAVGALNEGFALEVEDGDEAGHGSPDAGPVSRTSFVLTSCSSAPACPGQPTQGHMPPILLP